MITGNKRVVVVVVVVVVIDEMTAAIEKGASSPFAKSYQ